jgi:Ankyrin repeats (3 copies)
MKATMSKSSTFRASKSNRCFENTNNIWTSRIPHRNIPSTQRPCNPSIRQNASAQHYRYTSSNALPSTKIPPKSPNRQSIQIPQNMLSTDELNTQKLQSFSYFLPYITPTQLKTLVSFCKIPAQQSQPTYVNEEISQKKYFDYLRRPVQSLSGESRYKYISQDWVAARRLKENSTKHECAVSPIKELKKWREDIVMRRVHKKTLRQKVLAVINKMNQLGLCPDDLLSSKIISTKPFEKKYAKEFILAAKEGDVELVKQYLLQDKYLTFDFDYTHKTAMHWAVIRGHYKLIECLIQHHTDVDCKDLSQKTPLQLAMKSNDVRAILVVELSDALVSRGRPICSV